MHDVTCLLAHTRSEGTFQAPFVLSATPQDHFPSASVPFDSVIAPAVVDSDLKSCLLHVYEKDILVKRPSRNFKHEGGGKRTKIFEFSQDSANRLNFVARNSGHKILSQMCFTFHEVWPDDGLQVKKMWHNFLTKFRRSFPLQSYLWCIEFQDRTAPHFHFYSSLVPTLESQASLTDIWLHCINAEDNEITRWWHNRPVNFFPWQMTNGTYLVKEYISKSLQKSVPENFQNVGRFWGHSHDMKPTFVLVDPEKPENFPVNVDESAIKKAIRVCRKIVENRIDNHKKLARRKSENFELLVKEGNTPASAAKKVRRYGLRSILQKKKLATEASSDPGQPSLVEIQPGVIASPRVTKKTNLAKKIKSYTLPLATACFFQFIAALHAPSGSFLTFCAAALKTT